MRLAALPTAVGCARRFTATQLRHWELAELIDGATLAVSELVTNAVQATGAVKMPRSYAELHDLPLATVVMRLRRTSASLVLEVWDADPHPPVPVDPGDCDEGGRGLSVVAAVAKAWGHYPSDAHAGGKVVWAELDVGADPAPQVTPEDTPRPPLPRRVAAGRITRPLEVMDDLDVLRRVRDGLRGELWDGDGGDPQRGAGSPSDPRDAVATARQPLAGAVVAWNGSVA
ncbi:MAG: ATP-binding protein [Streptosporangiales bacterium]|nr:ATP-binding protein [Streptosporangiales bacterium]